MNGKRATLIVAMVLLCAAVGFAQQAVFDQVNGKVELRPQGGSWQTAEAGDMIPTNATISTGFGARAVVAIGQSTVTVDSLTRLTLQELVRREGVQTTGMSLDVGRVEANVQSAEGLSNNFNVRSARSTASVRGTQFSYDGTTIQVSEGVVAFANNLGQNVTVSQGQGSQITGNAGDPPRPGEWWASSATQVSSTTAGLDEEGDAGGDTGQAGNPFADIIIEF
jgi:hypothetical protein